MYSRGYDESPYQLKYLSVSLVAFHNMRRARNGIRIMNIKLGELKKGQCRKATESEFNELRALLSKSKGDEEHE